MPEFIRTLDPKLVTTVIATVIARLALELFGLAESDPLVQGAIALAAGGASGYFTGNDGTILRTEHDDGNPDMDRAEPPLVS